MPRSYRAVNNLPLGYKSQSLNAVEGGPSRGLIRDTYKT